MALSLAYDHDLTLRAARSRSLLRSLPVRARRHLPEERESSCAFASTASRRSSTRSRRRTAGRPRSTSRRRCCIRSWRRRSCGCSGSNGFLSATYACCCSACALRLLLSSRRDRDAAPALLFTLRVRRRDLRAGVSRVPALGDPAFRLIFFAYLLVAATGRSSPDAPGLAARAGSDIAAGDPAGRGDLFSKRRTTRSLVAPIVTVWLWWRASGSTASLVGADQRRGGCAFFGLHGDGTPASSIYQAAIARPSTRRFRSTDRRTASGDQRGTEMSTNDSDSDSVLRDFPSRFSPQRRAYSRSAGISASCRTSLPASSRSCCGCSRARARQPWRLLMFCAVGAGSAVGLLIYAPFSWSGGGGPTGNRHIIGAYAATFFSTPPMTSCRAARSGVDRRRAVHAPDAGEPVRRRRSRRTWLPSAASRGVYRSRSRWPTTLPVALILARRAHAVVQRRAAPYFLDEHAYPPEADRRRRAHRRVDRRRRPGWTSSRGATGRSIACG